jgi:hypothetical protein
MNDSVVENALLLVPAINLVCFGPDVAVQLRMPLATWTRTFRVISVVLYKRDAANHAVDPGGLGLREQQRRERVISRDSLAWGRRWLLLEISSLILAPLSWLWIENLVG